MEKTINSKNEKKFGNYFLLTAVFAVFVVFLIMIKVFILPLILALVLAIIVHPFYRLMLKLTKNRESLSSLVCCIAVIIALLLPLYFVADMIIEQCVELYRGASAQIEEISLKLKSGPAGSLYNSFKEKWPSAYKIDLDLNQMLNNIIEYIGAAAPQALNKASKFTVSLVFNSFVIIFSLFYFLRDGEKLISKIKYLVPISTKHKERVIAGFHSTSNAIIKGIFIIALIQSVLATITLWVFGVKAWLLWGAIMFVLSVIPFVGTGVVLVPAGIIKIITGDIWQGIVIILISIFFISLIDNVLRPRMIGRNAGMHDLLVFFSIIGGVFTFGSAGLVVGPLLAAMFLTMIEIYEIEFQSRIDASGKNE